ncbi:MULTISPECIES: acyl-CoA dehydrogenase family protein [Clostridium]|uniref:Butyryl-CoA dehydrogenase n=1 Tax=Clostridium cadaveris TaxID=1529 RepID=A0A1I2PEW5_9CLOT|nr:acyl-CoA dehydrogenase family protein [Clostridium cadaveris]MDU4953096.1 acyl-CoA dehydrogenase family protein [Clostridium sp.]MDM8311694.1 acyl-CoA dehydrogenase family protein [Clostridium cadaveris]MDY4950330.1 acyl-CoA dehydrogenase family protein [Clostridium cadaveris]NME64325.1 acyl-CoA dehydrogenase [Clostridium cadaveris]NWK11094.1 acyl-CoA dehydrogenase family protein [Clostridium cadaveris]
MAYIISEEAKDLLEDVKEFCENEVKEQCKEYDVSGEWPKEIYDKAIEMQLHSLEVPEEYGGPGLDRVSVAALIEQMAIADAGFATTISASGLGMKPVLIAGSEELKKKACNLIVDGGFGAFCLTEPMAGSDAGAGKTTAVKDGDSYVLNGRKCFITNGAVASFYCVTAMTDKSQGTKGISMFFVEAGTPGLSTGNHENKMGIRTSNTCDVVFEDCRIPAENLIGQEGKGFKIAMQTLDQARTWMGCVATGIAQRGINEAIAYGKERIQFGKPIIKNQALQFKIADMEIKTETARQMVAHALTKMDMGLPYAKESAIAKCYASDIAMEVSSEAIQMFGGYGYSREYPVEKLLRDAKIFQIFEGTNEIQRIVIANNVIGR